MKHISSVLITVLVAVFLWANGVNAEPTWQPLVFSEHAGEIAKEFGEVKPENVLVVVVTKAPDSTAYVVIIMKNGHRFKWTRGPYGAAIKHIRAVLEKLKKQGGLKL